MKSRDIAIVLVAFAIFFGILFGAASNAKTWINTPTVSFKSFNMPNGRCVDITGKLPEHYGTDVISYLRKEPEEANKTLKIVPSFGCSSSSIH